MLGPQGPVGLGTSRAWYQRGGRKREGTMASVAETIRKHHVEILRLRAEEAQKFVSARGLTESAFVNILPSYVSSLSETDDKMGRVGS